MVCYVVDSAIRKGAIMITSNILEQDLPEECNVTLDHANIHMQDALLSESIGDTDQVIHNVGMMVHILILVYNKRLEELGE